VITIYFTTKMFLRECFYVWVFYWNWSFLNAFFGLKIIFFTYLKFTILVLKTFFDGSWLEMFFMRYTIIVIIVITYYRIRWFWNQWKILDKMS
jgi:hypothetical protein